MLRQDLGENHAITEKKQTPKQRYRAKNRDKLNQKNRDYRKKNKEKIRDKTIRRKIAHPEIVQMSNLRNRTIYKEQRRLAARAQYAANPEISAASCRRRRARQANAPVRDFTAAQWVEMQAAYRHCCAYCGKRAKGHLTQDHITPLSQGGSHTVSNIVPACKSCNCRKYTGPPQTPVQPLLLTVAPSKKKAA